MNILAIDTTTKKANVGVKTPNLVKVKCTDNEVTHSEKLLPLIDKTLAECNLNIKEIDCIATTTGPGSFTGIRIGLATTKALAKVTGVKIYAINSLSLLAHSVDNTQKYKLIVSLIDAKNNRAYSAIYLAQNIFEPVIASQNKCLNEIFEDVAKICINNNICENEVLVISDTLNIFENIPDKYLKTHTLLNIKKLLDLASHSSTFTDYLKLDATYVRSSEAERTKYGE